MLELRLHDEDSFYYNLFNLVPDLLCPLSVSATVLSLADHFAFQDILQAELELIRVEVLVVLIQ